MVTDQITSDFCMRLGDCFLISGCRKPVLFLPHARNFGKLMQTRSRVCQGAHSLVETTCVADGISTVGSVGPKWIVRCQIVACSYVENASCSFLGGAMGRPGTPPSLLPGALSRSVGCSYCSFLYPSFHYWYQKLSLQNNIFLAESKSDVGNIKYHFCLVYQVILPQCRWPDNMDHISIRKIKTNQPS